MKPHPVLFPFSLLYGGAVWLRNWFFDKKILKSVDVGAPVISVGNITAGGTGKTPMVIAIGKMLIDAGKKVGVISRGYGRKTSGTVVVSDGGQILADAAAGGDEPMLIARRLKGAVVIVDEQRVRAAKQAVREYGVDVVILDDGFQHRYVRRSIDIVLMDVNNSPFNTALLPAGYRREPLSSLKRATAVLVTKAKDEVSAGPMLKRKEITAKNKFSCSYSVMSIRHVLGSVEQSLALLKGHSAVAVSGVANPENFLNDIMLQGVNIKEALSFRDHHHYTKEDIVKILNSFIKEKADFILTTEKDAVKLEAFRNELNVVPVFALAMDISIHQQEQWKKYILSGVEF